ncbi:MAG TPA: hypothetical protein VK601_16810, partial [Kofleriaceae bacterium]|nr:hypothetical protein [Kofleriaceae bacterium]
MLEIAVEAALGDRLGGVLVSQPEVGLAAVGFLKKGGGGRSAFVPVAEPAGAAVAEPAAAAEPPGSDLAWAPGAVAFEGEGGAASWMSPAWADGPAGAASDGVPRSPGGGAIEVDDRTQLIAAHAAIGGEGVLGRMADLVAFADGYESVGKRLLGTTTVVDDLARALQLHRRGVTDRLVTLDGDVVDGDGVVAGGSRDAQGAGVLAQKREIRELEEIVAGLEHDLANATAILVSGKTELKQLTKAIEGLRGQVHQG